MHSHLLRRTLARHSRWFTALAAGCLLAGAAAGCRYGTAGTQANAAVIATPDGGMTASKYVLINNSKLAAGIQVVDIRPAFANDLLQAQVTVVSKTSRTQKFQYKFQWYNAQGLEVEMDRSPWTPVTLVGNESKTIGATAPNPGVREFRVNIRAL
ncbi:MAG: YcfL family protein [Lentisphaeria bacterium]